MINGISDFAQGQLVSNISICGCLQERLEAVVSTRYNPDRSIEVKLFDACSMDAVAYGVPGCCMSLIALTI